MNVRHPLTRLSPGVRRNALWLSMLGVALFGLLQFSDVRTLGRHGHGIVALETMRTSAKAQQVLADYGREGIDAARDSLYFDYGFLIAYALALALACLAVAERMAARGRVGWAAAGALLAWCGLAAGLFDAIENTALLRLLDGHTAQPYPGIAFAAALPKFALAGAALAYVVAGSAVLRRQRPA